MKGATDVNSNIRIWMDTEMSFISTPGWTYYAHEAPAHLIACVVAERQFALDRAAQMTMWLAKVQVKEKA